MKKKIIMASLVIGTFFCGVASAAPLTDYSFGKIAIDLNQRNAMNSEIISSGSYHKSDFERKEYNFDGTATVGLGNNVAVQYRYFRPQSLSYNQNITYSNLKIKTNEFNVLYQLNKNVSALAGWINANGHLLATYSPSGGNGYSTVDYSKKNFWQVGLIASNQVYPKTTLLGMAAVGKNISDFEIGLSYKISENIDFNVNYRKLEIGKFNSIGKDYDSAGNLLSPFNAGDKLTTSGLGYGITYRM